MSDKPVIKDIDTQGKPMPRLDKFEFCEHFDLKPISLVRLTICGEVDVIVFCELNGQKVALQVATNEILEYFFSLLPAKPNLKKSANDA